MKKIFFFFILFFVFLFPSPAKALTSPEYKRIFEEAEELFINENYPAALPLYLKLDSLEKGNANTNFKIGLCYLQSATYKTHAIPYLEFAVTNITENYDAGAISEKHAPLSAWYYLGKAYHLNYEFDKAVSMYSKYRELLGTDPKLKAESDEVAHDIETCGFGKELVQHPRTVIITNLGPGVNSAFSDFSPVMALDEQTLIFTSRREGGANKEKDLSGQYSEDIYSSTYEDEKWSPAVPLELNTTAHEASVNLSPDGQRLLVYKDHNGNGGIYESELNGKAWSEPKLIAAPVNSSSWESHACYTADNRIIYFVSDRPGGFGGRDIYKCVRLPDGNWGPAQNLGNIINTPFDEDGVFIHPDGKQIFFSSKGHNSMGGFDIFTSVMDDENGFWSTPVNYGPPVNTPDDDVFLITNANGKRAFFSSDKEGGYGEKDIYMVTFPENEPRDITVLVGKIINNSGKEISNNMIVVLNTAKGDTLQTLKANSATGKFGTNLPVGAAYKINYYVNGNQISSETIEVPKGNNYQVIRREIPYGEEPAGKTTPTPTVASPCIPAASSFSFNFSYNNKEIDEQSPDFSGFIQSVATCLKSGSKIVIEVESSASTVPTSKFKSNKSLAAIRAKAGHEKILKALIAAGVREDQLVFAESRSLVQGPAYRKDAKENAPLYMKYQYLKASASVQR